MYIINIFLKLNLFIISGQDFLLPNLYSNKTTFCRIFRDFWRQRWTRNNLFFPLENICPKDQSPTFLLHLHLWKTTLVSDISPCGELNPSSLIPFVFYLLEEVRKTISILSS